MEGSHRLSVEQMSFSLAASSDLAIEARSAEAARKLVAEVLSRQRYSTLSKAARGTVRQYLMRVTGYARAQIARPIREYSGSGGVEAKPSRRRKFPTRYTRADIELLASVVRTFTICGAPRSIANTGPCTNRRRARRCRSENGGVRTRRAFRGGCGWTRYIRAIRATANPGCTTSMLSVR